MQFFMPGLHANLQRVFMALRFASIH